MVCGSPGLSGCRCLSIIRVTYTWNPTVSRGSTVWVEIDRLGEVVLVPEEGHSVRKGSATCALGRFPILLGLCPVLGDEESNFSVRYVVRVGDSECV